MIVLHHLRSEIGHHACIHARCVAETPALVDALRSGHLGGAAIDVCDPEPIPADSPLRSMDNVVCTSHVASASVKAVDALRRTAAEIALSVLAEIVAERRAREKVAPAPAPAGAVDPVCGMTVAAVDGAPHADVGGTTTWFCCEGCRTAFLADPDRYAVAS